MGTDTELSEPDAASSLSTGARCLSEQKVAENMSRVFLTENSVYIVNAVFCLQI